MTLDNGRTARSSNPAHGSQSPLVFAALGTVVLLCGALRAHDDAEHLNPAFEPLAWLVGEWQAEFRPREGMAAPTMSFRWADEQHSFMTLSGTTPVPGGGLEPEYESLVVWHPAEQRFVFLGAYRSAGGRVTEDGEIEVLADGGIRLHMNVHYPPEASVPFTDGLLAGSDGHTLRFTRTFHPQGPDALRGTFLIERDGVWVDPHPDMTPEGGYPWRRIPEDDRAAAEPLPDWVREHWQRLVGTWVADNSPHTSEQEPAERYTLDWSWGIGETSLVGRLYGLAGGEEIGTLWQFREYWHPGEGRLVTEQFGGGGTYGVGPQSRKPNGSFEVEQTFYYPAAGVTAHVGHRASFEGDRQKTTSFDIDEQGRWTERRTYIWRRVPQPEPAGGDIR